MRSPALVCFSPHPDDAALSCGGLLAQQAARGRPVHTITVLTADPPPLQALHPFARELHRRWGDPPDPMAERRAEDARALALLGCSAETWDYPDAIYRHPAYCSEEGLFGAPAGEAPLEDELAARCAAVPSAAVPGGLLLFPLAVGHHVDHQLLFRVGWRLLQAGRPVAFYEDVPYAAWEGSPARRLAELGLPLRPHIVDTTAHWPAQEAAISCYASQLAELEHDGVPVLQAAAHYARSLCLDGYAGRFWDLAARPIPGEAPWS